MKKEQMTPMQERLLEMLSWFHGFCTEHHLRYYALGGTMLGAVRHQGFIPWDDDVDVGMPRTDYRRFSLLMKACKDGRYILETPDTDYQDFYYPYAKLYDTQTTLVENTRCKIRRGIYLDVFPLDGAGETERAALRHYRPLKWKQLLLLAMTAATRTGRNPLKNAAIAMAGTIPDWMLNRKRLLRSMDKGCGSRDFDESQWVGNLMGNWMERELTQRSVFGEPKKYPFENLTIYGAQDYESYLTKLYGNWRQLPPPEKRKTHHDFLYMDLTRSFLQSEECHETGDHIRNL